ncbi:hypothetical protein [Necropsobacter massiliensis]|uniref:hypothetical protein n=1 Tax=Necropsobacter massiliensis TaxID=1400001 RepID=UPI000595D4F3|nr:hypothetical protein [Necropsobacter massiliensis]
MLKKILLIVMLITGGQPTWADPFDKTRRNQSATESAPSSAQAQQAETACNAHQATAAGDTAFDEFTIIGVVIYPQHSEILLTAKNHALLSVRQGDFIAREKLQIDNIDTRQIRFLRWQQETNCAQPSTITVTF